MTMLLLLNFGGDHLFLGFLFGVFADVYWLL